MNDRPVGAASGSVPVSAMLLVASGILFGMVYVESSSRCDLPPHFIFQPMRSDELCDDIYRSQRPETMCRDVAMTAECCPESDCLVWPLRRAPCSTLFPSRPEVLGKRLQDAVRRSHRSDRCRSEAEGVNRGYQQSDRERDRAAGTRQGGVEDESVSREDYRASITTAVLACLSDLTCLRLRSGGPSTPQSRSLGPRHA